MGDELTPIPQIYIDYPKTTLINTCPEKENKKIPKNGPAYQTPDRLNFHPAATRPHISVLSVSGPPGVRAYAIIFQLGN